MKIMKFVPNAVTVKAARTVLLSKKHSPTLLFAGGVTAGLATVVTACRATLKVEEVLEDSQKDISLVKTMVHEDYSEEDRKKDLALVYLKTTGKLCRLYGPSVVLGVTSVVMLTSAHNIQTKRIAGLTAAYTGLDKSFKEYRKRVTDELGEEKDREFRYGTETRTVVEKTEKGEKKSEVKRFAEEGVSEYARLFNEFNRNWNPSPEHNLFFLRSVQNYLNDRLKARGHCFLNDAYDELGMERTSAGAVVGWVWDPDGNLEGDNYIDFGIWDAENMSRFHDFMTGNDRAILIDFNVDGIVYDKI